MSWLEAGVESDGDLARLRERPEVEALGEIALGVLGDFRVVSRVLGIREEVLNTHVQLQAAEASSPAGRQEPTRNVVVDAKILAAQVGAILHEQRRRMAVERVADLRRRDAIVPCASHRGELV